VWKTHGVGDVELVEGLAQATPGGLGHRFLGDPQGEEASCAFCRRQGIERSPFAGRQGALGNACGQWALGLDIDADGMVAAQHDQRDARGGAEADAQARTGAGRREFRLAGLRAREAQRFGRQAGVGGQDRAPAGIAGLR